MTKYCRATTALCCLLGVAACSGGGSGARLPPAPPPTPLPVVDTAPVAAADPGSTLAEGWEHGAFMQIFVRSYADSDGDGSGDLRGLISRLDYLRDLGIKGLWLMPVMASQDGDHGYAVRDYRNIEAAYGSLADFDELLRQAHARGIGVTIDYVINHSAAQHPLFVNASAAADNPFRAWYVWQNPAPGGWKVFGANPWRNTPGGAYYAPFWDQMPDFNLTLPAVLAWHQDNLRFWLNRGVDGFRFDAVGMLVENGPAAWENQAQSYTVMAQLRQVAQGYLRRSLVCEAPADPRGFAVACGSAFAFDLNAALVNAARGNAAALQAVSSYFSHAPAAIASFVSNHDSFAGQRLWDQLGGDLAQYKLVAATYLLLPGRPTIYYGEELGMAGAAALTGDPKLRTPMSWTADTARAGFTSGTPYRNLSANVATHNAAQAAADPASLLNFYRAMLGLRNSLPSISRGSYEAPFVSGSVIGWQRAWGAERTVTVINYGSSETTVTLNNMPANAQLLNRFPAAAGGLATTNDGSAPLLMPAQSVRVLKVQP